MIRVKGDFTLGSTYGFVACGSSPFNVEHVIHNPAIGEGLVANSSLKLTSFEYVNTSTDFPLVIPKTGYLVLPPRKSKIDLKEYLRENVWPAFRPPKWSKIDRKPKYKQFKAPYLFRPPYRRSREKESDYQIRYLQKKVRYDNHITLLRSQHNQAFQARLIKWTKRYQLHMRRLADYDKTYQHRLDKYQKRKKLVEARIARVKTWLHKPRLVIIDRSRLNLPDNPYTRERIWALGGEVMLEEKYVLPQFDYWMQGPNILLHTALGESLYEPGTGVLLNSYYPVRIGDDQDVEAAAIKAVNSIDSVMLSMFESEISDLDDKILRKIESKVRQTDFHLGNIIAERVKTFQMFKGFMERFVDLATGKKKIAKSVSHFIGNPRKIADNYLAFKFGVEPLLKDMYSLGELLAEMDMSEDGEWLAFRANNKFFFEDVEFKTPRGTFRTSGMIEISYVVKYTVSESTARYLNRIGLVNPAEIAWEMLPWSFVIDWVVPVQKWIASGSTELGIQFKTGTRKILFQHSIEQVSTDPGSSTLFNPMTWAGGTGTKVGGFSGSFTRESKRRTVLTELPWAPPPGVRDPLSLTHLFEALALLVQKLFK